MNIKRSTKKFHYKMNLDTRHVLHYVGEVSCIIENLNFFVPFPLPPELWLKEFTARTTVPVFRMLPFFEGVVLPGDFTFVNLLTAWSFALDLLSFELVLVIDSVSDSFLSADLRFLENEPIARILAPDLLRLELVVTALLLLLLPLPLFPALLLSKAFIALSTPVGFFHAVLDRAGALFLSWTLLEKLLTARILAPDLRRELLLVLLSCSMMARSTMSCPNIITSEQRRNL